MLAENGRLTRDDCLNAVVAKIGMVKDNTDYIGDMDDDVIRNKTRRAFELMTKERFLSRVSQLKDLSLPDIRKPRHVPRANVSKTGKKTTPKKKRKIDEVDDLEEDPQKRKKEDVVNDSEDPNAKLWKINYDQFARRMRHEKIVEHVAQRLSNNASVVIKKMLQLSGPYEKEKNDTLSSIVKFKDLHDLLQEEEDISESNLERLLEALGESGIVNCHVGQVRGAYNINLGFCSDTIKRQNAIFIIEQKFGMIGSRIFRVLFDKKMLEEKQITQLAMIPSQECRSVLYKMLKCGMLQLQEVPKSSDHHPTRTFFLWNVELSRTYEKLLDDMFKTVRNLRMKLGRERLDALNKISGGDVANVNPSLSTDEQILLDRFGKVEARLEFSILQLMELLMVFENFTEK